MQKDFEIFKKEIIKVLEEKKDFIALKDYLTDDFYLENEYHKDFDPENPDKTYFKYDGNKENLKIISEQISIDMLLFVLKKGEVIFYPPLVTVSSDKVKDSPEKCPTIDFKYNEKKKKWGIEYIRFLRL